jgi:hypothetical protein
MEAQTEWNQCAQGRRPGARGIVIAQKRIAHYNRNDSHGRRRSIAIFRI